MDDETDTDEQAPDPRQLLDDPARFREAHSKYGSYLKAGGLPFEPEELDDVEEGRASDLEGSELGFDEEE